jgi:ribosome modulation factor
MLLNDAGFLNARHHREVPTGPALGLQSSLTLENARPYDPHTVPESPTDPSLVVRTAVRVGEVLGHWRRRRATAAQDAYIERWKAAWSEGYHAGFQRVSNDTVPYRSGPQRDAWLAGWHWASTHTERHNPNGSAIAQDRPVFQVRPRVIGAAGGGAVGVAFFAAARWLSRSRRQPPP